MPLLEFLLILKIGFDSPKRKRCDLNTFGSFFVSVKAFIDDSFLYSFIYVSLVTFFDMHTLVEVHTFVLQYRYAQFNLLNRRLFHFTWRLQPFKFV